VETRQGSNCIPNSSVLPTSLLRHIRNDFARLETGWLQIEVIPVDVTVAP